MQTSSNATSTQNLPESIELHEIEDAHHHNGEVHEFSLPQADGGKEAWLFLAGCFVVEAFLWGFPYSYGVLQEYYSSHEPFASKPSGIAAIGSSSLGIMYLDAPFMFMIFRRWPNIRRYSYVAGVALLAISLVASSFAQEVWQLIMTQGVMYALGGSLIYSPVLLFLDEWFIKRKGMAYGAMWAGTGASGVAIPFLIDWGLERFEFRTILRAWGIIAGVVLGLATYVVKPRLPISTSYSSRRRADYRFVMSSAFIILQACNILQGLGFFIPGLYLPTYAKSLGLSNAATTATISLLNSMGVFGCLFVGFLIDRLHVTTVLLVVTIGSVLSVFIFWGLSANMTLVLCFSALYGFFANSFSTTWTGIVMEVKKQVPSADTGLIFGLLAAGRGIGSIAAGPLSEALLKMNGEELHTEKWGYGSGYESLIVFTGVSVAFGGFGFGARRLGWL